MATIWALIEQTARAIGVPNATMGPPLPSDVAWAYGFEDGVVRIYWADERGSGGLESLEVSRLTAAVWLLALASSVEVDVGPCQACGWARQSEPDWTHICQVCMVDGAPTGRDVRSLARLMIDSMPRDARLGEQGDSWRLLGNGYAQPVKGGDPTARHALAVEADRLAQAGSPLGPLLAAWLAGDCRRCKGTGHLDVWASCPDCGGSPTTIGTGQVLGAMTLELEQAMEQAWDRATVECSACGHVTLRHWTLEVQSDERTVLEHGSALALGRGDHLVGSVATDFVGHAAVSARLIVDAPPATRIRIRIGERDSVHYVRPVERSITVREMMSAEGGAVTADLRVDVERIPCGKCGGIGRVPKENRPSAGIAPRSPG